jgi:transcriptional regulator with XRE-family HTH domain
VTTPLRDDVNYCPDLPPPSERRLLRKAAGWSLQKMADEVGVVGHSSVIQWERGAEPSPPFRATYAELLEELREQIASHKAGAGAA